MAALQRRTGTAIWRRNNQRFGQAQRVADRGAAGGVVEDAPGGDSLLCRDLQRLRELLQVGQIVGAVVNARRTVQAPILCALRTSR